MPRFHFNVSDGYSVAPDDEGAELDDVTAIQDEALIAIRELLSAGDKRGMCRRHWRMDVTDETGVEVFNFPFGHALRSDRVVVAPNRA